MKKIIPLFLIALFLLLKCQQPPQKSLNNNQLSGLYLLNMDSLITELGKDSSYISFINKFGTFIRLIKIQLDFKQNNAGEIDINTSYLPVIREILDSSIENNRHFFYKIKDSILYISWHKNKAPQKWAIIHTNSNLKYIKLKLIVKPLVLFLEKKE